MYIIINRYDCGSEHCDYFCYACCEYFDHGDYDNDLCYADSDGYDVDDDGACDNCACVCDYDLWLVIVNYACYCDCD